MNQDIRWLQRFENYQKAYSHLDELTQIQTPNWIEQTALIKVFEIIFELAWKTLKDYLESEGVIAKSPREVLKQSFQMGLINSGEEWLDALEKRNLMAHRYDEDYAKMITSLIAEKYAPLFEQLHTMFVERKSNS